MNSLGDLGLRTANNSDGETYFDITVPRRITRRRQKGSSHSPADESPMEPQSEKDNANPTILSSSELPARRKRRRPRHANGIYSQLLGIQSPIDPSPDAQDSSDSDSEGFSQEPIDEQEVYGESCEFQLSWRFTNDRQSSLHPSRILSTPCR